MSGQWLRDPEGRFEYRWWDGQQWTDQVSHQGQVHAVPLGAPPAQAQPEQAPPAQQQPQPQQVTPTGDGFAGITGDLVDGRFSEKEAAAVANQNKKLLRVRVGEPFLARQGSMVAYQGNV
ncbi:MAG: DUF2510 domain-containing protein, partial [Mycobacterium sp.]